MTLNHSLTDLAAVVTGIAHHVADGAAQQNIAHARGLCRGLVDDYWLTVAALLVLLLVGILRLLLLVLRLLLQLHTVRRHGSNVVTTAARGEHGADEEHNETPRQALHRTGAGFSSVGEGAAGAGAGGGSVALFTFTSADR